MVCICVCKGWCVFVCNVWSVFLCVRCSVYLCVRCSVYLSMLGVVCICICEAWCVFAYVRCGVQSRMCVVVTCLDPPDLDALVLAGAQESLGYGRGLCDVTSCHSGL